jgi:phage tail sheath protein FI
MARTTYRAPGVYVEEIPSARQPIAGVGTNTAAFIGIVPDTH